MKSLWDSLGEEFLRVVGAAKENFARSSFSNSRNSRQTWQAINRITKRKVSTKAVSEALADELNSTFAKFFDSSDVHADDLSSSDDVIPPSDFYVSGHDVFCELKRIRSSSAGHDHIKGWLLKLYAHEFASPLSLLFNRCFQECHFPRDWKRANILPLPKGNSEFRPISLLPAASKVLERIFVKRFCVPFLKSSFNRFQFGFLPSNVGGCCNAVTYTRHDVLRHIALTNGYVRMVQIDFQKAFDRANHSVILSALSSLLPGRPWILKFIHSYLSERFQRVLSSSGHSSSWTKVTSGVPQGSVLGPLLFALMINNFPSLNSNSKLLAYADDLILLHHVDKESKDELQSELSKVIDWAASLKLLVNLSKFKSITFSRVPVESQYLSVNNTIVPEVSESKFLGVVFQSDLKWAKHASSSLTKASRNMFLVKSLWLWKAPPDVIWMAYLSYVFNVFAYCWPALCDIPLSTFNKFVSLEKRACRWSARSFSKDELRDRLDSICSRLIKKIATFRDLHPLSEFFSIRPPSVLRHTRALQAPNSKKAFYRNSFIRYASLT